MAYSAANPPILLARSMSGAASSLWAYSSTDDATTVGASGYFANASNLGMNVGDIILINESDNDYAPQMHVVSDITTGAATAGVSSDLEITAGVGITGGTGTICKSGVSRDGGIITTRILVDLTGLNSGGTAGDIIGTDGAGAAYLGQITDARNGVIYGGKITFLEAIAGGDADIDLYAADEATGVEDTAIGDLTEAQLANTAGADATLAAWPTDGQYLYLVGQAGNDAAFTGGRALIELYGG